VNVGALRGRLARAFLALPPGGRRRILHAAGRYAPWEPGFDHRPPPCRPDEVTGPPDFVGIGAQKAGTTWWYGLIAAHPAVSSPEGIHKERHFFDRFGTAAFGDEDIAAYHGWFPRRSGSLAGEWTPDYLTYPWAPPLLRRAAPEAKLLLLLRDPVERFGSGLAHRRRMGFAVDGAAMADAANRGFYDRALRIWLEHFEPSQVLVLQYERCVADIKHSLQETWDFLGLPRLGAPPQPNSEARISSARPSQRELTPDTRTRLVEMYSGDVVALAERLPQIDLALWPNFAYLSGEGLPPDLSPGASSPTRLP
jgi:hypothetical protein